MSASRRLSFPSLLILLLLVASCRAEPSRTLLTPSGPREFKPAERGVTVVHLWATWCPPCVRELPAIDSFRRAGTPDGVTLVLVSTEEPLERSLAYLRTRGFGFDTWGDPEGGFRSFLRAGAVPTTVVLAPDGQELERRVGAAPWEDAKYRAHLASLGSRYSR